MKYEKVLPISLMIWPYLLILPILSGIIELPLLERILDFADIYYLYFTAGLAIVTLIGNVILPWRCKLDAVDLAYWNRLIKLVHIPFYLFAFMFGLFVPMAFLFVYFIDVLLLVASSSYGITALIRARHEEAVSAKSAWLHGFLHLVFVADVVSALFIYRKMKIAGE